MKVEQVVTLGGFGTDGAGKPTAIATYDDNKILIEKHADLTSDSEIIVHTRLGWMPKIEAQMLFFTDAALKRMWNYIPKNGEKNGR